MPSSGSTDFSVSRDNIITEALQICGVVPEGGTANANQLSDCSRTLNMMIKNWQIKGYNLFTIQQGVIFPVQDKVQYKFGGSGPDHSCLVSDLVYTTVATVYVSGTSLVVASGTGMTNADFVGVVLTDGTIEFRTFTIVGATLTLSSGLSSAAAVGNFVYTYTTKMLRPLRVLSAFTRDMSSLTDTNVRVISKQEYDELSSKTSESSNINQLYYDAQHTQSFAYLWPEPSDMTNLIYVQFTRPIEDFDASGDTPDFPQEWYLPISWNLAALLSTKYGVPSGDKQDIKQTAMIQLADTLAWDTEGTTSIFVGMESQ